MNELIEELATQCRIEEYNSAGDLVEFGFDYEKFAELIVQECAEVVKQSDSECNDEWDYAERDLCGIIKQHFGFEQ